MSNVLHTNLFDAKRTMDYIIVQRDKAWTKFIHYQFDNTLVAYDWMYEWVRCNEALVKIKRDFPNLEKVYEAGSNGQRERRADRS